MKKVTILQFSSIATAFVGWYFESMIMSTIGLLLFCWALGKGISQAFEHDVVENPNLTKDEKAHALEMLNGGI